MCKNLYLKTKKEINLFFNIFYKQYKILFFLKIKKNCYINKFKYNKNSLLKTIINSNYIKLNITFKLYFFSLLKIIIIKPTLLKYQKKKTFYNTKKLYSNNVILLSSFQFIFFNKTYKNILLNDKNYYNYINNILINNSYKLKIKLYRFIDCKFYNIKNNFTLKIKKELLNLDWFLTLITLKNKIKKNNKLKSINSTENLIKINNDFNIYDEKLFINDCKLKFLSLFVKSGKKSKALRIWFNIIQYLNYKLITTGKISNNLLNINISYIFNKAMSNIIPLAILKYRNNIISLKSNIIPHMILRVNNYKNCNILKLKSKKKKLLSLHEKLALQWIIQALNLLDKKKKNTIKTLSFDIASLLWDTAFFNDSKIIDIKKNYYKNFY